MSMRIDSCRPFFFYTDSPSLTLADIQTKFPTATKTQHIATVSSSTRGKELYLVWAGYEITINNKPVFGTNAVSFVTEPIGTYSSIIQGISFPTDKIRLIADYTPPASAKGEATEDLPELEKI